MKTIKVTIEIDVHYTGTGTDPDKILSEASKAFGLADVTIHNACAGNAYLCKGESTYRVEEVK